MEFVRVGNEYITLARVELVIPTRESQDDVVRAEVHVAAGSHRQRTYEGEAAQALVAGLEKAGTRP